jgi:hypothetical protein
MAIGLEAIDVADTKLDLQIDPTPHLKIYKVSL